MKLRALLSLLAVLLLLGCSDKTNCTTTDAMGRCVEAGVKVPAALVWTWVQVSATLDYRDTTTTAYDSTQYRGILTIRANASFTRQVHTPRQDDTLTGNFTRISAQGSKRWAVVWDYGAETESGTLELQDDTLVAITEVTPAADPKGVGFTESDRYLKR